MGLDRLVAALDFQEHYEQYVRNAAILLRQHLPFTQGTPRFAITLGSGLGDLTDSLEYMQQIHASIISRWPVPRAPGHEGSLVYGTLQGVPVLGFKGRVHYYDVADEPFNVGPLQVIFGVDVAAQLGIPCYFATNSAGGLDEAFQEGDVMIIHSHLTNIPNPLLGRVHDFGRVDAELPVLRFPPLHDAYDAELSGLLLDAAPDRGYVHEGTYYASTGPTYETVAECQGLRTLGVDAVGMSTVPEVIAARSRGMRVVAFSLITNAVAPGGVNATDEAEVLAAGQNKETRARLARHVENFFSSYAAKYPK